MTKVTAADLNRLIGDPTSAACEWCGRAVKQNAEGYWYAVKGEERGYDPLICEASDEWC